MDLGTDSALEFFLLWILVCLRDLIDPVGLLEGALLGDVISLLAQDVGGDFLQ